MTALIAMLPVGVPCRRDKQRHDYAKSLSMLSVSNCCQHPKP